MIVNFGVLRGGNIQTHINTSKNAIECLNNTLVSSRDELPSSSPIITMNL